MGVNIETKTATVSAVADVRRVPLGRLSDNPAGDTLRRIVPTPQTTRVAVAAFNASL